jgi:mono/diheme cytochrome c family protein
MSSASPTGRRARAAASAAALLLGLLFAAGCRQDMANQPKKLPLTSSSLFDDGRSERPLVEGTVYRGQLEDEALAVPQDSNVFPLPVTKELLERGRERFNIFCSPCHGLDGDGSGMVTIRGFRHPPSYHIDRLRRAPVGHFYDVIANGFGAMSDYAAQVPPRDRWAIIAYIRALQLSRNALASELPAGLRERLKTGDAAP